MHTVIFNIYKKIKTLVLSINKTNKHRCSKKKFSKFMGLPARLRPDKFKPALFI